MVSFGVDGWGEGNMERTIIGNSSDFVVVSSGASRHFGFGGWSGFAIGSFLVGFREQFGNMSGSGALRVDKRLI